LDKAVITIGRLPTCDVALDDSNIGRLQAVIEQSADGSSYAISDLRSSGRTTLNGSKVSRAELGIGDELAIGDFVLRFEPGEASVPTAAADDVLMVDAGQPSWTATDQEMASEPATGEVFVGEFSRDPRVSLSSALAEDEEPILLTRRKSRARA
jgi:pSer/pThr/pTyr-binding forkhead associated (FHA) protein